MSDITYLMDVYPAATITRTDDCPPNRSQTGYGSKIPCGFMVDIGDKKRRRVYAICWSNAATLYVLINKNRYYIRNYDID